MVGFNAELYSILVYITLSEFLRLNPRLTPTTHLSKSKQIYTVSGGYHELFNDKQQKELFETMHDFINKRLESNPVHLGNNIIIDLSQNFLH